MKKIIFMLMLVLGVNTINAQVDEITKHNGEVVKGKVSDLLTNVDERGKLDYVCDELDLHFYSQ